MAKGDSKLAALKEKKTRILEEVMENETYKVAVSFPASVLPLSYNTILTAHSAQSK